MVIFLSHPSCIQRPAMFSSPRTKIRRAQKISRRPPKLSTKNFAAYAAQNFEPLPCYLPPHRNFPSSNPKSPFPPKPHLVRPGLPPRRVARLPGLPPRCPRSSTPPCSLPSRASTSPSLVFHPLAQLTFPGFHLVVQDAIQIFHLAVQVAIQI